jgi:hypothetical protein
MSRSLLNVQSSQIFTIYRHQTQNRNLTLEQFSLTDDANLKLSNELKLRNKKGFKLCFVMMMMKMKRMMES